MAAEALPYTPAVDVSAGKRISWPAVFGGTLVALATELLFAAFGLFIGFTMSRTGGLEWGKAWYFVTAFVALLIGSWVAARLSVNTFGSGRLHGAVTWGLTTLATFMIAVWMSWGVLSTSIAAVRTAVVATNTTTESPAATPAAQNKAQQLQNQAANTVNQAETYAPQEAGMLKGDASTLFLVIFGGILCGCVGSLIGGSLGAGEHGLRPAAVRVPAASGPTR
jgi:hypothetical protein